MNDPLCRCGSGALSGAVTGYVAAGVHEIPPRRLMRQWRHILLLLIIVSGISSDTLDSTLNLTVARIDGQEERLPYEVPERGLIFPGHREPSVAHECAVDEYGRYIAMKNCLSEATDMVKLFNRKMEADQNFKFCRRFAWTLSCIEDVTSKCPSAAIELEVDWKPLISHISCACKSPTESCVTTRECIEMQLKGDLAEHCDNMYYFNMKQRTRDKCFFTQVNVDCKLALVSSACGSEAATVAYHLLKIVLNNQRSTSRCQLNRNQQLSGFRYHDDCPDFFLMDMRTCTMDKLRGHLLTFNYDLDLVADESPTKVKEACRYYREYSMCMRDKKRACPKGHDLLLQVDPLSRLYLLKMSFICHKDNRKDYRSKLPCYQEVLRNDTLMQCDYTWVDLKFHLRRITAYDFYCRKHSEATQNVMAQLDRVRACYIRIFNGRCGHPSGDVMGTFMARVMQDPEVLNFSFTPDCELHKSNNRRTNLLPTIPFETSHIRQDPDSATSLKDLDDAAEVSENASCSSAISRDFFPLTLLLLYMYVSSVT